MSKYALSTDNQQIIVAKYMSEHGSINRYEAEAFGVCHLAGRIKELKYKGFIIDDKREIAIDLYGLKHKGVSRYWFDYAKMTQEQNERLSKLLGRS